MRSAIRTYALAVDAPDALPKDALIPAAGHYAEGCAFCHGAPGVPRNPAVLAMLPVPPELSPTVDDWTDAQLFRIVKHGIRFTGMPAWPTQARDDEVWMMVAFLRALPELDSDDLPRAGRRRRRDAGTACPLRRLPWRRRSRRRRARADPGRAERDLPAREPARLCRGPSRQRHHADGGPRVEPRRAGGARPTLRRLAGRGAARAHGPTIDRAAELASRGRAADGVPACLDCHAGDRDPHFPTLAGQRADYIAAQLELFRAGVRGGTAYRPSDDPGRSRPRRRRTSPRWRRYFASLAPVSAAEARTR